MSKYIIDFEDVAKQGSLLKTYHLDKEFFSGFEGSIVTDGDIEVNITVNSLSYGHFGLLIEVDGDIILPCDRCLDDLEVYIESEDELKVRYGIDIRIGDEIISSSEVSDEYDFTLPEGDTTLDLSEVIFELVELAIPLQYIHPEGECNQDMELILQEHLAVLPGEEDGGPESSEDDQDTDPRWDALKGILNNN